ncbi:MAG TPA: DnaJ C-terminal domain-containing protein, partial [Beijerinckiaceae bacterium]
AADDIFSQLFGDAFRERAGAQARTAPRRRGEDVSATLDVTLEEIAGEAKKRVALPGGREIDVVIPKGVVDGQTIRLRGLGQSRGGEPGDALLTIRIRPHERFTVEGSNLRVRVPIDLDEAVLGGTVRVPTLTGAVDMTIPPMTSSGRTLRLRGKGLPGKDGRGDLLAAVEIRLPETADEALLDYARKRRSEKAV